MGKVVWKMTDTQLQAWEYLQDRETRELLFGGGAGGGKTYLGCGWLITCCGQYPGTRWLMGRRILKHLRETTLRTFFDITHAWNIESEREYEYRSGEGIIRWANGSEIFLRDLEGGPGDPNFDSLGGLELTGAFIDEAHQIEHRAKEVVMSRIRYRLDEYGLIPKLLMTCNPARNWVWEEFYKPWKRLEIGCWNLDVGKKKKAEDPEINSGCQTPKNEFRPDFAEATTGRQVGTGSRIKSGMTKEGDSSADARNEKDDIKCLDGVSGVLRGMMGKQTSGCRYQIAENGVPQGEVNRVPRTFLDPEINSGNQKIKKGAGLDSGIPLCGNRNDPEPCGSGHSPTPKFRRTGSRVGKEGGKYRKFVPSGARENPYLSCHYISSLEALGGAMRARLLEGDWEFDDVPDRLMSEGDVERIFGDGGVVITPSNPPYLKGEEKGDPETQLRQGFLLRSSSYERQADRQASSGNQKMDVFGTGYWTSQDDKEKGDSSAEVGMTGIGRDGMTRSKCHDTSFVPIGSGLRSAGKYMTVDVARFGRDKTVIGLWEGLNLIHVWSRSQTSTVQVGEWVRSLAGEYRIPHENIAIDEDGVGGGVVDLLPGVRGFLNNSAPVSCDGKRPNFANLKTQCSWKLAELAREGGIHIQLEDVEIREKIVQELSEIRQKNMDKDGVITLVGKDEIRRRIGRSPDYADMIIMRMVFELEDQNSAEEVGMGVV